MKRFYFLIILMMNMLTIFSNPTDYYQNKNITIVGAWNDSFLKQNTINMIILKDNNYYLIQTYNDGSELKKELKLIDNKYYLIDSSSGDYLIIVNEKLERWDELGKIDTLDKIE